MTPTKFFEDLIATAVSQMTILHNILPANQPIVQLFTNDITPGPNTQVGDLVMATFEGSSPLQIGADGVQVVRDNPTGRAGLMLMEPLPGLRWIVSSDMVAPEEVKGWALISTFGTPGLIAAARFDAPIRVQYVGDYVEVDALLGLFSSPMMT